MQQAEAKQDFSKFSDNENNDSEESAQEKFEAILKKPIPVVRKTPVKNNQAGLNQLQFSLAFTQLFAKAYWEDKEDFGPMNMLSLLSGKGEEENEEDREQRLGVA